MWQSLAQSVYATGGRVMLTYQALDAGADNVTVTAVTAAQAVPALLAAFTVGRIADRRGGRPLLVAGYLLATVAVAVFLVAQTLGSLALSGLVLCGLLLGTSNLLFAIGQQAILGSLPDGRDAAFSTYSAAISVGQVVGAPLATLIAQGWSITSTGGDLSVRNGMVAVFAVLVVSAVGLPRIASRAAATGTDEPAVGAWAGARQVAAVPGLWTMVLASGATLAVLDLLQAFLPIWGQAHQIAALTVSLLLGLRGLITLTSRIALPALLRRIRQRDVLCWSSVGAAAGILLVLPGTVVTAAVAMVIVGFCLGLPQPISLAWVSRAVPAARRAAALGLRLTANRCAQICLPPTFAMLPGAAGTGVFIGCAALLAAVAGVLVRSGALSGSGSDPAPTQDN